MDHIALDRTGADDRDLDDKVVESIGLQPRQHVDLRPAFDLEDAERLASLEHGVGLAIPLRDVGKAVILTFPFAQQVKRLADAGQHAQRQHIDLHQAQRVDIVLVPFDEGAIRHRGLADRHGLVEAPAHQNEAADMLREMAREAEQAHGELHGLCDHRVVGIEPGLVDLLAGDVGAPTAPLRRGEPGGDVLGQPQRLAGLADGAARPVMDHGRGDAGALAAIGPVDPLDHLLAPLMLEIDVDIGRLAPLLRDEAREEQGVLGRIDRGDAERVADGRIGGRAPALAENALAFGELDDLADGQEIAGIVEPADQDELVVDLLLDRERDAVGIAHRQAPAHQLLQPALRRPAGRHRLVGILVFELLEIEFDATEKMLRLLDRLRRFAEEPGHLLRGLEMALGIGLEQAAGPGDRRALANAGHEVLEIALFRRVVEHIVRGDQRSAGRSRDASQPGEAAAIIATARHGGGEPDRAGRGGVEPGEQLWQAIEPAFRHDDQQEVAGVAQEIVEDENAFALRFRFQISSGQQAAEPAPAGAIGGIGDDIGRAVGEDQPATGDELEGLRLRLEPFRREGQVGEGRILDPDIFAGTAAVA